MRRKKATRQLFDGLPGGESRSLPAAGFHRSRGGGRIVTCRFCGPAGFAVRRLASLVRVAALSGIAAFLVRAAGRVPATGFSGSGRSAVRSGEGEGRGNSSEDGESEEGVNSFHGSNRWSLIQSRDLGSCPVQRRGKRNPSTFLKKSPETHENEIGGTPSRGGKSWAERPGCVSFPHP